MIHPSSEGISHESGRESMKSQLVGTLRGQEFHFAVFQNSRRTFWVDLVVKVLTITFNRPTLEVGGFKFKYPSIASKAQEFEDE